MDGDKEEQEVLEAEWAGTENSTQKFTLERFVKYTCACLTNTPHPYSTEHFYFLPS